MTRPETHPLVGSVLRAIPFRRAVEVHAKLKSGEKITPDVRRAVREGVRRVGRSLGQA